MTRIDLIPPELVEKHQARRIIGLIAIGSAVIFAILIFVYVLTLGRILIATDRVDQIAAENTKVQAHIAKLKPYNERKTVLDDRQKIVETIVADQVLWSSVLNDISMVVPNDIWLKSVKMDIGPILSAKASASATSKTVTKPPITIVGNAFNHAAVARWLVHLGEINQFRGVWLDYATEQTLAASQTTSPTGGTATSGAGSSATKVIEFQTTVKLTKFSDDAGAGK